MVLMTALEKLRNGRFFQDAAEISGVEEEEARKALARLVPAIARRLKAKAEQDAEAYEDLLDLLEDGADLDDLAGAEAVADGNAILSEIYGSRNAAITEARKLAADLAEIALAKLAAIAATAVLASLARRHAPAMGLVGRSRRPPGRVVCSERSSRPSSRARSRGRRDNWPRNGAGAGGLTGVISDENGGGHP